MAVRRRYLRLEERCNALEIPHMMCRVVEDPLLPLQSFRPRNALGTQSARSTKDIIPDILPRPTPGYHPRLSANVGNGRSFGTGVWPFFETELLKSNVFHEDIEAVETQTYTLSNPASYFEELMEDDDYARDVAELLTKSKKGVIYLVTGFMTGRGMMTRQMDSMQTRVYVKLTIPTSAAYAPGGGFGDPSFSTSRDHGAGHATEVFHPDEEIFAVSYSIIKQPRKLAGLGRPDARARPQFVAPRFATRTEVAYADEDDSDESDLVAGLTVEDMPESEVFRDGQAEDSLTWF